MEILKVLWGARSEFSLGESIVSVSDLFTESEKAGYTHIALADTMTVSALIDATKKAENSPVNLIAGCRLQVEVEDTEFAPKVYPTCAEGFQDLLWLMSQPRAEGKPWLITLDNLASFVRRGRTILTTGDTFSLFGSAMTDQHTGLVIETVTDALTSDDLMAHELVAIDTPYYARQNARALKMLPSDARFIISQPTLYATSEDAGARDVVAAIIRNQKMSSGARRVMDARNLSFRAPIELALSVAKNCKSAMTLGLLAESMDLKDVVKRSDQASQDLAGKVRYKWQKADISLPQLHADPDQALKNLCVKGFRDRLIASPTLGYLPAKSILPAYIDRLKSELNVISRLGFSDYFLVVEDLVSWSKNNEIIVGPGRGSVGGSLVAFLTGITDIDPIRFDLIFERFLNPERIDLPDADLDFMSTRREEVIQYLRDKYGEECVAGISNYNSLKPASALREVSRVFQLPTQDYSCSKWLPKEHGSTLPLADCLEQVPELETYAIKHPHEWNLAQRVVGKQRTLATHAAGVVVAGVPLVERAVVEERKGSSVVNWDKRVVEEQGLVKIDILGLSTLDVLSSIISKVYDRTGKRVDLVSLPLNDKKVLEAFGSGKTVGIFQFESGGMRKLLKDIRSGGDITFEDLVASTALYRPGPMDSGMLEDYVAIRQGLANPHYDDDRLKPALEKTFGIMIYQEAAMQVARDMANFTMAEADHLRKAIGKKDPVKMASMRQKFVDGALANKVKQAVAERLWEQIESFGGYGFNRSHAVEYTVISYWQMWLKCHYPVEFYAASLELQGTDRLHKLVQEAKNVMDIDVLPPDINLSSDKFEILDDKRLLAPFSRVKFMSHNAAATILEAREAVGGEFKTLNDMVSNVNRRCCNKRVIENLRKIGGLLSVEPGPPIDDPSRVRDQLELLPGLIIQKVAAERAISSSKEDMKKLSEIILDNRTANGGIQPTPKMGRNPKFMVIFDCPTNDEERVGRIMEGESSNYVRNAMKACSLSTADGYFTTMVKTPKAGKQLTNEEINSHLPFLQREIELFKPPIIVTLGSTVSRTLCPEEKGPIADLAAKVVYRADIDASVVLGINPMMIYFNQSMSETLEEVFRQVADLID